MLLLTCCWVVVSTWQPCSVKSGCGRGNLLVAVFAESAELAEVADDVFAHERLAWSRRACRQTAEGYWSIACSAVVLVLKSSDAQPGSTTPPTLRTQHNTARTFKTQTWTTQHNTTHLAPNPHPTQHWKTHQVQTRQGLTDCFLRFPCGGAWPFFVGVVIFW